MTSPTHRNKDHHPDIVLIGAGIMSATLGMLLKELDPSLTIEIIERLDHAAAESSDAWNNAGTGHSAFCELNYTPQRPDGSVDISKAVKVAESFEQSRQFWAFLTQHEFVELPTTFIRPIPHMSFVWGEKNVAFLRKRYEAMRKNVLFQAMQYSEEPGQLTEWMPLIMQGRESGQQVAATYMPLGTDVNFGALTRAMFHCLKEMEGVTLHFNQEVRDLDRQEKEGTWEVSVKNRDTHERRKIHAKFVFIGAGGGSLPLLLKSGIPEGRGYGGFPVSGQWLRCTNSDIISQHHAKVYGKAEVGSPPMSVPHLDTRMIKGKQELLFGPYAGFSTKFLKKGSFFDLPFSVNLRNIRPMIAAGLHNIPLTRYLIEQVSQTPEERLGALKKYYPEARLDDWELEIAGQRVQVIKKDEAEGGILEFGTEVVSAADGSLAALLGASPGASTAVSIMLSLLEKCFPEQLRTEAWQQKLRDMIPSYGQSLGDHPALCHKMRTYTSEVLDLAPAE
jgi:malate dehydrogenase (quinone)